jgi:DivIVA domain-containing protein
VVSSPDELGLGFGLGFKVVWRGYDRSQVDDYIERLSGATPPADPPSFELARRGYESEQVDARIRELRTSKGLGG